MREVTGNLWEYPADVRVITTNGTVKKNGECVMGRGCAAEAKARFPNIDAELGRQIKLHGNNTRVLRYVPGEPTIVALPVKHHWYDKADMDLITKGAKRLVILADQHGWKTIVLPRPGCGNGHLKCEHVRPVLAPILDDRFHVITFR